MNFARLDPEAAVLHRTPLDRRNLRRHSDDQPWTYEGASSVRLAHEVHEHLFGGVEVGDDAIAHRSDRLDVGRSPAEHLVGFDTDCFNRAGRGIERDNGGFVEDDAPAACEHAGVCGAKVDRHIGGERGHEAHGLLWILEGTARPATRSVPTATNYDFAKR